MRKINLLLLLAWLCAANVRGQGTPGSYSQLPMTPLPAGVVSTAWQGTGSGGPPAVTQSGGPAIPLASPPINYDFHIRNANVPCELFVDEFVPGLGFSGGTYGPVSFPGPPGSGPANAYIHSHLQTFQFPQVYLEEPYTNAGIAYMSGVWIGFSPETRVIGGPDQLFIDVYVFNAGLGFEHIASYPFTVPTNIPTLNVSSPTDFTGYLNQLYANQQAFFIPFSDPVFISSEDHFVIGLRVQTETSDDKVAFYYTYGLPGQECHLTQWRVIFADVNTHQLLLGPGGLPVLYNNYWGGQEGYGNPVIIPQITFEDQPPQDCALQIVNADIQNVRCFGESNGRLSNIITSGAIGQVTFRAQLMWDADGNDVSNLNIFFEPSLPGTFTGLPAGDYLLYATDLGANCTIEADFEITQPPLFGFAPEADAGSGTITVNAFGGTPGYSYSISPPGGSLTGNVFSGLSPGTYAITVLDANGCEATDEVVLQFCDLTFTYSITSQGGCNYTAPNRLTFNAQGGTAPYTYYVGSNAYTSPIITGLGQGTEIIYVADAVGCQSAAVVVTIGPLNANISTTNPTGGQNNGRATIIPVGGSPSYQVLINPNLGLEISEGEFINLPVGTYQVRVTDGNGCSYNTSFTLTESAGCPYTVSHTFQPSGYECAYNVTFNILGGTPPYTIEGIEVSLPFTFESITPGDYTVTVADGTGCETLYSLSLPTLPVPSPSFVSFTRPSLGNSDGSITVRALGTVAPYSVELQELFTGSMFYGVIDQEGGTFTYQNLPAGIYRACATDQNGCSACTEQLSLDEVGSCFADNIFTTPSCSNSPTGSLSFTVVNGNPPFNVTVTGVGQFNYGASPILIQNLAAGEYNVTLSDNAGCQISFAVNVEQISPIFVEYQVSCATPGNNNGTITVNTVGTPRLFDQFDNQYTGSGGIFGNLPGNRSFRLEVTDADGCLQIFNINNCLGAQCADFNVVVEATPASIGNADGSVTFTVSGGGGQPYSVYQNGLCGDLEELAATGTSPLSIGGLSAGSYTYCVTSGGGCSRTVEVVISEVGGLMLYLNYANNPTTGANGEISVFATGGSGTITYTLYDSLGVPIAANTTGLFTGLAAGVYFVDATDATGATSNTIEVVLIECNLQANFSAQQAQCTSVNATFNVSGGVPPYSYFANGLFLNANSTGTFSAVGLSLGCNVLSVRDGNGCEVSQTICIEGLSFSFTNVQNPGESSLGSFDVVISNGAAPYTVFLNGNFQTTTSNLSVSFSGLQAGVYCVRILDQQGCEFQECITLSAGCGFNISTEITQIGCAGATDGQILLCASGGTGQIEYSTDTGLNWFVFEGPCMNFINLAAGTYIFLLRDATGCVEELDPIILSPQFPAFNITNVNIVQPTPGLCNGQITLFLDGGLAPYTATVNAQPVAGAFFSPVVNITGQCGGTKTVCISDANGCTVCEQLLLDCGISVSVASLQPSCAGQQTGRVTLSAVGGVAPLRYSRDGVNFQTSPIFTGLAAGSYTFVVQDAALCDVTVNVTVPSSPQPNIQIAQIDPGQNQSNGQIWVDVFGGTSPIRIRLRNAAGGLVGDQQTTSFQFLGLPGGCYTVEVQDGAGCLYTQQVCLAQPCTLAVSATPATIQAYCAGEVIELFAQASEQNVTYQWTGLGLTGPTNMAMAAAVHFTNPCSNNGSCLLGYEVVVRNAEGCEARDTVIVRFVPAVTITALGPTQYVQGAVINTLLTASAPGNAQVQWFLDNVPIPGANSPSYTATQVGCYTAGININGQFFACNTGAVCISADIIAGVQADTIFYCDGDLCVNVSAVGPPGTQFYWTPPGGLSSQYGETVCIRPRRTTTYSVVMTDANGNLLAVDEFVVVRRQRPVVSVVPQGSLQFCDGAFVDLVGLYSPNYRYTWLRNGVVVQEGTGPASATYRATQTGAYVLRVTDLVTGCSREGLAVPVNVNPAPFQFSVTPSSAFICGGESATFTASVTVPGNPNPSVVFTWTLPNGTTFVGNQLTTSVPGTYSVTANVEGSNCVPTRTVTLQVSNLAVAQTNIMICNGQTATLSASGANSYVWTNFITGEALGTGATLSVMPSVNTAYLVTSDCGQTATVTVTVLPFNFNPPADVYICANNPFNVTLSLTAPFPQVVQWFLGSTQVATGTSIQVNPSQTTTYRVVGSNLNGCTAEDLVTVFVADEDLVIDFDGNPATFNDDFELICAEEFYQFDPIIRNSSGEAISTGLNYRWDWIDGDSDFTEAQRFSRNPSIQVFGTTTFTLTVGGAGCEIARTITLETLPAINAFATGPSAPVCSGGGAQLNVVFTDGSNPNSYAYEWLPGASLSNPFVAAPIANPVGTTTYTVVITDPNTGCQINRDVTVNVSSTPVVAEISGPSIVNRCTGETFNFETPDAGPGAQYFWYVNNVLAEGPPFSSRFFNWNQGGLYRVEVIAGECQATAERIVLNNDIAVAPTNFTYDCPTNLISWVESQSGLVEQIEWLPAGSPSNFIWNVLQVDISNSFQGDLTEYYLPLPPGFYRLRIRSRCGGATSEYVTLNNVYVCGPCEDAGQIVLSPNPDGTSIQVSWNAVPNAAGYRYELGTVAGSVYNWSGNEQFTTTNSVLLTGLTPGINYAVRVRTQCDPAGTNFSEYIEAEFNLSQQLCQAPAVTVTPNNCSSATITWTAVTGAANYRLEIVNNATGGTQIETVTGTSFNATGLSENTSYTFRVRTNCASGFNSPFTTAQATIPTCPQPCFPVTNIRFRNVTPSSVTVEWNAPANNQFTTGYTVEIRRTGSFALVAGPVSTTSLSVTLPLPGTPANEYVAIVRTNCQGGSSAEASQALTAEQCNFPGTENFNTPTVTSTSIVITWDAPAYNVFYILRLVDQSGIQQYSSNYVSAFEESYTFANVQPGRSYILYITVVCEFDNIVIDDLFFQAIQMPAACAAPQGPLTVFNTTTSGFTAVWQPAVANPDIEELPSGYVIEVRETIGNALVYSEVVPGAANSSVTLSGLNLQQGVSYTVLVYGDCSLGDSNPISTTFTIPVSLCGTPTIVSFNANADQFNLSWTAGAGNVTGYRVDIEGIEGTVISESLPATTTQIINYNFDSPLSAGTYTVSVTAICDNGELFSSPATQSFLITGPVCLPPTGVEAVATGLTTVNVSWTAPANGSAVSYNVYLYNSNNILLAQQLAVSGTSTTITLGSSLLTGSYTVEVLSNCLGGATAGPATDGFSVVVECTAPVLTDANINTQSPTYDQIAVSWTPALGATYVVEYWNEDLGSGSAMTASIVDNVNGTALITGLDYCVRYQIRLRTTCPNGQEFTALAPTAVRPTPTVTLNNLTSTGASFTWVPIVGAQSVTIRTRNVTSNGAFGPAVTLSPDVTNFTVTQVAPGTPLLPGTQYETRITFVFPSGSGCPSLAVVRGYTTLSGGVGRLADDAATGSFDDMSAFSVYPNPNRGMFTVSFEAKTEGIVTLRLFDMNGRAIHAQTMEAQEGVNSFELDMTGRLPSGLYLLQVTQGGTLHSTKLVIE